MDSIPGFTPDTWALTRLEVVGDTIADLHIETDLEGHTSEPWPDRLPGNPA